MGKWTGKRVAVLYGGQSSEREVSLKTGAAIAKALQEKGYDAVLVDVDPELAARLRAERIAVAFNGLHGRWGEDGCVQGLLEAMRIPYTGSGVTASAIGMDKVLSKLLFRSAGLLVCDYRVFPAAEAHRIAVGDLPFGLPCIVKPANEGSSVGVSLVREEPELTAACREAARWKGDVIVERYVKGKECQVAVLEGKALGVIEVVPANAFYDYAAKYTAGTTQYHYPARISDAATRMLLESGERAHRALGCVGVTRTDFILVDDATAYVLEVNTLPGMTATSLVPKIAAGNGIPFPELCERLLDGAALKA